MSAEHPTGTSHPLQLIAAAISDPGHWTPRGDDYEERLIDWSARAVLLALASEEWVVRRPALWRRT